MGTRKYDAFNGWTTMASDYFRVIAHPCRIQLISLLLIHGSRTVGELTNDIPTLSQSTISEHLRFMRENNFITGKQTGTRIDYTLDDGAMEMLRVFLEFFSDDERLKNLSDFDMNNNAS